jgi:hypothetical protein
MTEGKQRSIFSGRGRWNKKIGSYEGMRESRIQRQASEVILQFVGGLRAGMDVAEQKTFYNYSKLSS